MAAYEQRPAQPDTAVRGIDVLRIVVAGWQLSLRSTHTRAGYSSDFVDWMGFCETAGLDVLRSPRRAHVDAWVHQLKGRLVRGKPLSQATIGRRLATVSSFYGYTVTEGPDLLGRDRYLALGLIDHNPAANVRRPEIDKSPTVRGLAKGELRDLLAAARDAGHRDEAVVCLLGLNGLRVSSVCTAEVTGLTQHGTHRILTYWLKRDRTAKTALAPRTAAAIDAHLADRDCGVFPEQDQPSGRPLMLASDGSPLDRFKVARIITRLARAAGLPDPDSITPHSCRRAFITHARHAGATPEQVQDAADHRDPRTTRRYQQADDRIESAPTYLLQDYLDQP